MLHNRVGQKGCDSIPMARKGKHLVYKNHSLFFPDIEENRKTRLSKSDEFITKESQRYNVSVLVNRHQDFKMVKQVLLKKWGMF